MENPAFFIFKSLRTVTIPADASGFGHQCARGGRRSRRGASHELLSRLPDERFEPVISVPLFAEYRSLLLRPENLLNRPPSQAENFLDFLLSTSHLQEVFFLWRPALADPDDELILELAIAAGCRYIVTHNLRDFRRTEQWGITAMTPGQFLKMIEKKA